MVYFILCLDRNSFKHNNSCFWMGFCSSISKVSDVGKTKLVHKSNFKSSRNKWWRYESNFQGGH